MFMISPELSRLIALIHIGTKTAAWLMVLFAVMHLVTVGIMFWMYRVTPSAVEQRMFFWRLVLDVVLFSTLTLSAALVLFGATREWMLFVGAIAAIVVKFVQARLTWQIRKHSG